MIGQQWRKGIETERQTKLLSSDDDDSKEKDERNKHSQTWQQAKVDSKERERESSVNGEKECLGRETLDCIR